jgi:hypothetical protein
MRDGNEKSSGNDRKIYGLSGQLGIYFEARQFFHKKAVEAAACQEADCGQSEDAFLHLEQYRS